MTTPAVEIVTVLDSVDPDALAGFWCAALRYRQLDGVEQYAVLVPQEDAGGPMMLIQGVPEPKQGKNRCTSTCTCPTLAGEVDRLVALGAQRVGDGAIGDAIRWVRMPTSRATSSTSARREFVGAGCGDSQPADELLAAQRASVTMPTSRRSRANHACCCDHTSTASPITSGSTKSANPTRTPARPSRLAATCASTNTVANIASTTGCRRSNR